MAAATVIAGGHAAFRSADSTAQATALGRRAGAVSGPVMSALGIGANGLLRHATVSVVAGAQDIVELLILPSAGGSRREGFWTGRARRPGRGPVLAL